MSRVRFELNRKGVREFLQSEDMMTTAKKYAGDIKGRCGEGFETGSYVSFDRVHTTVYPATKEARKQNLDDNTILKSAR